MTPTERARSARKEIYATCNVILGDTATAIIARHIEEHAADLQAEYADLDQQLIDATYELTMLRAQLTADRDAVMVLVEALPKCDCDHCEEAATTAVHAPWFVHRHCGLHQLPFGEDLSYAPALRALLKRREEAQW